jgi:hypothetical protein
VVQAVAELSDRFIELDPSTLAKKLRRSGPLAEERSSRTRPDFVRVGPREHLNHQRQVLDVCERHGERNGD